MKQSMFASTSGCRIPRREDKPTSLNSTKLKQKQEICSTRDPFHDIGNGGGGSIVNLSSSSSVSSIEAPRGCLRFFLNPSSKPSNRKNSNQHRRPVKLKSVSSAKTPSSRVSEKTVGVQGKSGRNCELSSRVSSLKSVGVRVSKLKSGSGGCNGGRSDSNSNSTPLRTTGDDLNSNSNSNSTPLTDVKDGSSLKSNSNTKTPPLHSTVSPEIQQCQSSVISTAKSVTTTPVCYGAGHLLSGVTDKRKCRPRGLLVVGEDIVVDKFDIDDVSPSTLPVKASMHWLNSPANKEEARNRRVVNDSPPALPSSSCNGGASSDMSEENTRRMACSSEFGGFPAANASSDMDISPPPQEKLVVRSPLSMEMSVVQTPESEYSSRVRNIVTRWSNENGTKGWGSELDSVDRHLQKLLSTPATSSQSSFRSDPGDLLQFQKAMDIRDAQLSTSTLDDVSRSEVGISWRDGLVSRIFELDELDCCRCLSDEEVEIDSNNVDLREVELRNDPDEELGLDGNGEDDVSCLPAAAAESMAISSDGGALFQSDDSDWTQCYKNQLFKI